MNARSGISWEPRSVIWAAAILAGSAAFFLLVARPQSARARELRQTVQDEQAEVAARFQSLEAIAKMEKEAGALTARTADFDRRVPSEPMLGSFLEELARMAQRQALQSDAIQPGEPVRSGEVFALPIAIKVRGPFSRVHALLSDVERMPRLTRIERFTSTADEEHPGNVIVELDLKIFYQATDQGARGG